MKTNFPDSPVSQEALDVDISKLAELSGRTVSARLRQPGKIDPISHIFTINPNVDTESLLCHASETLASLNAMSTDLAYELEGSRRNVALAIQQLAVLGELLVNRVLDDLEQPDGLPKAS
ncbi:MULTISPECIES: DUF6124 family protein [Pseudomonas]|jgi:hypothetical protein|uniref:DUF6124 family protein n=1 Tax=Pseudomonas TaxID=286 RepID=UPI000CFF8029|nr:MULTISPECIES: DUF6124 family protein [Pseudomonas]PRA58425.1 hypothetical protein CQZ98_07220 [Pseudomonas sp. MYb115]QXN50706.1 hypothetical protein KW062_02690 [Pseudomonas fluorescens]WSO25020.1 DUF6124 family protein [Pseudomonas fluorescens]